MWNRSECLEKSHQLRRAKKERKRSLKGMMKRRRAHEQVWNSGGVDDGNIIISDILRSVSYMERQLLSLPPTLNKAPGEREWSRVEAEQRACLFYYRSPPLNVFKLEGERTLWRELMKEELWKYCIRKFQRNCVCFRVNDGSIVFLIEGLTFVFS